MTLTKVYYKHRGVVFRVHEQNKNLRESEETTARAAAAGTHDSRGTREACRCGRGRPSNDDEFFKLAGTSSCTGPSGTEPVPGTNKPDIRAADAPANNARGAT